MSSLCDTVRDCNDGSDEGNCPAHGGNLELLKNLLYHHHHHRDYYHDYSL